MTLKNPQSTRGIFMVCEHLPQSHCYTATFTGFNAGFAVTASYTENY